MIISLLTSLVALIYFSIVFIIVKNKYGDKIGRGMEKSKECDEIWKSYPLSYVKRWRDMDEYDIVDFMIDNKIHTLIDDISNYAKVDKYDMSELNYKWGSIKKSALNRSSKLHNTY